LQYAGLAMINPDDGMTMRAHDGSSNEKATGLSRRGQYRQIFRAEARRNEARPTATTFAIAICRHSASI
jgi:hypothetical protein